MKKINDLKQERASLIAKMDEVIQRSESSGSKTEADEKLWKDSDARVAAIDAEILQLERQEELNKSVARTKPTPEEDKIAKRYDISKAIFEVGKRGILTGLEAEMHQEAERELSRASGVVGNLYIPSFLIKRANEATKTTGASAGHIATGVSGLDVIAPEPLFRTLGCTVFENLSAGKLDLPFSQGHSAAKVAEAGAAVQSVPTQTKATLTAGRFQGWQVYTQEYLAESSVMAQELVDMVASIERGIGSALLLEAVAANVASGYATSDTAAAVAWVDLMEMLAVLNNDLFRSEAFVMSKQLFFKYASKAKESGFPQYMVEYLAGGASGKIAGISAFGTGFLPIHDTTKYDIMYGDMSRLYVGLWSGVQLLVDPFTQSDNGYTKITFSRMGDTAVNPYAITSRRNVSLA
jgi:hypothetical protein